MKGQTTTEFLLVLSIVILIFLFVVAVQLRQTMNTKETSILLSAKEMAARLGRTINQVYKAGNSSFQTVKLEPTLANNEPYNLTVAHRRVEISWSTGVYQYPILVERVYFQGNSTFNITSYTQLYKDVVALAIGDGDNDLQNELYAGIKNDPNLYEILPNGSFVSLGGLGQKVVEVCVGDVDPAVNGQNKEVYVGDVDKHIYQYVYSGGGWTIHDLGAQANELTSLACGDGDNDGRDELYFGLKNNKNVFELSYEGGWVSSNLGGDGFKVRSLSVGDGDQDMKNEVFAGDDDAHIYKYELIGSWVITDMGEQSDDVIALACGDGDNDGRDELYFGVRNDANLYELLPDGDVINRGGLGFKVEAISIGDADNDPQGLNEIYLGDKDYNIYRYSPLSFDPTGKKMRVYNDEGVILIEFL